MPGDLSRILSIYQMLLFWIVPILCSFCYPLVKWSHSLKWFILCLRSITLWFYISTLSPFLDNFFRVVNQFKNSCWIFYPLNSLVHWLSNIIIVLKILLNSYSNCISLFYVVHSLRLQLLFWASLKLHFIIHPYNTSACYM